MKNCILLAFRSAFSILVVGAFANAFAQGPAATTAISPDAPVLRIGTQQWSPQRFEWLLQAGGAADVENPHQLAAFVDNFANRYVLASQAESEGLAEDSRIAERLAMARTRVLAEEEHLRLRNSAPIDASAIQAAFASRAGALDELRLSQILVSFADGSPSRANPQLRSESQALARAQTIQRKLNAGTNFNDLVRKYSDDQVSGAAGGQLPEMFAKDLKPEFATAIAGLHPNQVTGPLRASDGYHLIRLEERTLATFEGSRNRVELELREAWAEAQTKKLRDAAPMVFVPAARQPVQDRVAAGQP